MKGILIFIKNPILGKAKTRLAKDIGKEKALEIYKLLLSHTRKITESIPVKRLLYYAWEIEENDDWNSDKYQKYFQNENPDLGVKMHAAFRENFAKSFDQLIIVGSDCYDLTEGVLIEAFEKLSNHDAVIGPAKDGGYYLLGLNKPSGESEDHILDELFLNKRWSHENVAKEAVETFKSWNLKYHTLPTLSDIDSVKDLKGPLLSIVELK